MELQNGSANDVFGLSDDFVCYANTAVTIKLVRVAGDIRDDECGFSPTMSHQFFGEEEKIVGYKNLKILIYYSAARLNIYVRVQFEEKKAHACYPANIENLIFEKYETMFLTNLDEFERLLSLERSFKPFGTLLKSFKLREDKPSSNFEVYHCTTEMPEWIDYHSKLQTFIMWYIDAASYIILDERWKFFALYEKYVSGESSEPQYGVVGYATVYEHYAYPANLRPRISQILILPPYQKRGLGAMLLKSIYDHYSTVKDVLDITAEDPSTDFQLCRDFVDCTNCKSLPSFSKETMKTGFSEDMTKEAREHFKINKKQVRRVYEILRLYYTVCTDEEDFTSYRLCVKKRLSAIFQREVSVRRKLKTFTLDDEDQRKTKLKLMFKELLIDYSEVVRRLKQYCNLSLTV